MPRLPMPCSSPEVCNWCRHESRDWKGDPPGIGVKDLQPTMSEMSCRAMESTFKRDVRNYPRYFLLWTVLGLFYFSQGVTQGLVSHNPTPWWHYLVAWLLG